MLFWQCTFGKAMKQPSWQQITEQRTKKQKGQRPRPCVQWIWIVPESGQVLTHHHHMFNKTDTTCRFFRETSTGCTRMYRIRGICGYIIIRFLAKEAQQVHTASRD